MIPYASRYPKRRASRLVSTRIGSRYHSRPASLKAIHFAAFCRALDAPGNVLFYLACARHAVSGLSFAKGFYTRPMQRHVTIRGRLYRTRRHA